MKGLLLPLLVVISGCTVSGTPTDETLKSTVTCTDTRDGERFTFLGKTIRNVRVGLSDTCVDVTDVSGKTRTLCKSHEAFLKCERISE